MSGGDHAGATEGFVETVLIVRFAGILPQDQRVDASNSALALTRPNIADALDEGWSHRRIDKSTTPIFHLGLAEADSVLIGERKHVAQALTRVEGDDDGISDGRFANRVCGRADYRVPVLLMKDYLTFSVMDYVGPVTTVEFDTASKEPLNNRWLAALGLWRSGVLLLRRV